MNGYCGEIFEGNICIFVDLLCFVVEILGIGCLCYIILYLFEFNDDLIECYCDLL